MIQLVRFEVLQTDAFVRWRTSLRDREARARINVRIRRLSLGNLGDSRSVGGGVRELRIHYGPGYRVYLVQRGTTCLLLLAGGDKTGQSADIIAARALARQLLE